MFFCLTFFKQSGSIYSIITSLFIVNFVKFDIIDIPNKFRGDSMTLGEKLRQIRKEHNMTKQELSVALNVPRERIKLYEIGEEEPSEFYLTNFAQHFSISLDDLLALK